MTTDDDVRFSELSLGLVSAVDRAVEPWVLTAISSRVGDDVSLETEGRARLAATEARATITEALRTLLDTDLDEQRSNPLAVLRRTVTFPTVVLRDAGVAPVPRDADAVRLHPGDLYDLTPAAFADFGPDVHEAGLRWGAAKAHLHLRRRRAEEHNS